MFISTLGKDPSTGQVFDDVYGDLIQDILEDDAATDKTISEDTMEKDDFEIGKNIQASIQCVATVGTPAKRH